MEELDRQIELLVKTYGLRPVVNAIAFMCHAHGHKGGSLPYDTDNTGYMIGPEDLVSAGNILEGQLF